MHYNYLPTQARKVANVIVPHLKAKTLRPSDLSSPREAGTEAEPRQGTAG